ncbi:MAG: hypothetical protein GY835_25695 [bacterium]|nr:hypothetical protein [bacterium]
MKRERLAIVLSALLIALTVCPADAQTLGEWGDAPEGALCYPIMGVIGNFPTCLNVPTNGYIWHSPATIWAFFGPSHDFEVEGNAGLCSLFNPYDADECWQDGDAGLLIPPAYTIVGNTVIPCVHDGYLGPTCTTALWGPNIDITVTNNMPVNGYVNVLMDWNQNGSWGGSSNCPGAPAPEHVLVNLVVPMGFTGPISALTTSGFLIGPHPGFVWTRFSITELPVSQDWDGTGSFEDGETEDYLLHIEAGVATTEKTWGSVKNLYR